MSFKLFDLALKVSIDHGIVGFETNLDPVTLAGLGLFIESFDLLIYAFDLVSNLFGPASPIGFALLGPGSSGGIFGVRLGSGPDGA